MKRLRSRLWLALRLIVPIALLTWVFLHVDWQRMAEFAGRCRPAWLAIAFCGLLAAVLLQGARWHLLLSGHGRIAGFWPIQLVNGIAMFFDVFVPGRLGSDAFRVMALRSRLPVERLVGVLLMLRFQGLFMLLLCAVLAAAVLHDLPTGWRWTAAALGIAMVASLLGLIARGPRIRESPPAPGDLAVTGLTWRARLGTLTTDLYNLAHQPPRMIAICVLSVLFVIVNVGLYAAAGRAFQMVLPLSACAVVVPILLIAAVLPITIHGRGLTEVIAIALWQGPGATREQILLTCLAAYALVLLFSLAIGILWAALTWLGVDLVSRSSSTLPQASREPDPI